MPEVSRANWFLTVLLRNFGEEEREWGLNIVHLRKEGEYCEKGGEKRKKREEKRKKLAEKECARGARLNYSTHRNSPRNLDAKTQFCPSPGAHWVYF